MHWKISDTYTSYPDLTDREIILFKIICKEENISLASDNQKFI